MAENQLYYGDNLDIVTRNSLVKESSEREKKPQPLTHDWKEHTKLPLHQRQDADTQAARLYVRQLREGEDHDPSVAHPNDGARADRPGAVGRG
jgi:hypothetical protein